MPLLSPVPSVAPRHRRLRSASPWERRAPLPPNVLQMLQPECVLPGPPPELEQPAKNLLYHVFRDAFDLACRTRDGEELGEALWWFFHDPEPQKVHGFGFAADHLGINPDFFLPWFRRALEAGGRWLDAETATLRASYQWRRQRAEEALEMLRGAKKVAKATARWVDLKTLRLHQPDLPAKIVALMPPVPRGAFPVVAPELTFVVRTTHRGRAPRMASA